MGAADGGERSSARERAVARLKVLAGTAATGVAVACGYGVVDPLPPPMCFQSPQPTATGKIVDAPPGEDAKDVRFVQITVSFSQNVGSALSNATAREAGAGSSGASLAVVSQVGRTGAYDFLVRVPTRVTTFIAQLSSTCPDEPNGGARLDLRVGIDGDGGTVQVDVGLF
jgi:hypothetical protein